MKRYTGNNPVEIQLFTCTEISLAALIGQKTETRKGIGVRRVTWVRLPCLSLRSPLPDACASSESAPYFSLVLRPMSTCRQRNGNRRRHLEPALALQSREADRVDAARAKLPKPRRRLRPLQCKVDRRRRHLARRFPIGHLH